MPNYTIAKTHYIKTIIAVHIMLFNMIGVN